MSRTAFNNFLHRRTRTQKRVLKPIAELYQRVKKEDAEEAAAERQEEERREQQERARKLRRVAEHPHPYGPGELEKELKEILPPTREAATRWIEQLFEVVREHPDRAPPNAAALEEALLRFAETLPPEEPPAQENLFPEEDPDSG